MSTVLGLCSAMFVDIEASKGWVLGGRQAMPMSEFYPRVTSQTFLPALPDASSQVEGFGVTVGRAVALLHVVRQGLTSRELWALLAALRASSSAQEKVRLLPRCDRLQEAVHGMIPTGAEFLNFNAQMMFNPFRQSLGL